MALLMRDVVLRGMSARLRLPPALPPLRVRLSCALMSSSASPPSPSASSAASSSSSSSSPSSSNAAGEAVMDHFDLFGAQALATDTRVDAYGAAHVVVNNVRVDGAVVLGNRFLLRWKVARPAEISAQSLCLVGMLRPLPELLLIGTGRHAQRIPPEIHAYVRSLGVALDVMTTPHASATFNVLVQEGRLVAAALFPLDDPAAPAA